MVSLSSMAIGAICGRMTVSISADAGRPSEAHVSFARTVGMDTACEAMHASAMSSTWPASMPKVSRTRSVWL